MRDEHGNRNVHRRFDPRIHQRFLRSLSDRLFHVSIFFRDGRHSVTVNIGRIHGFARSQEKQ